MPQTIVVHITARSIMLVLLALAAIWLLINFSGLLLILFLAILLAVAITPLVARLELRMPRGLAIVLVYLALLSVVSIAVGLLVPLLIDEISRFSASGPQSIQRVTEIPQHWLSRFFPSLGPVSIDVSQWLSDRAGELAGGAGLLIVTLGRVVTTALIDFLLVLVVGFFLTSDARFTQRFIGRFIPPRRRPLAAELAGEIGGRLGHWVRAQLLVGLFYGVSFGLGLALLGVPYAFSLGLAGAILELVPYVGGVIVTTIAMLVALTISPWVALAVLALELLVATVESHVVYPKLVGDIVGLHPLTIVVALFIGAELRGIMGALLSVPLAIVFQVLFEHFYRFDQPGAVNAAPVSSGELEPHETRTQPGAAGATLAGRLSALRRRAELPADSEPDETGMANQI